MRDLQGIGMAVEVVFLEQLLGLVHSAAGAAREVVAPFQVLARPWVELMEYLVQMLVNLEDSAQGYILKNRALVAEKEALLRLVPLAGAAVLTLETPFQAHLSGELVERLAEVLVDLADSVMGNVLGRKRTLAVPLVQVTSTETVEPVFPQTPSQVGTLALEETLRKGASTGAGIVELAVLEEVL